MPTAPEALTADPECADPGYFVQVRSSFVRDPALSPLAKVLYEILLSYAADRADAWPGQARLSAHTGMSPRPVRAALTELVAAGLVTITRRGQGKTNLYHLHKLPTRAALRLVPPGPERPKRPIKNDQIGPSSPPETAPKLDQTELQTEKTDGLLRQFDAPGNAAATVRNTLRWQHRASPTEIAAGLAAWAASGHPAGAWLAALADLVPGRGVAGALELLQNS